MAYEQQGTQTHNGFAVPIGPDTQLGSATLIAEFGDNTYQPIGAIATINEARELVEDDMRVRIDNLVIGPTPACPEIYVVWARGIDGVYHVAERIEPL
jgi:hypothetical protein